MSDAAYMLPEGMKITEITYTTLPDDDVNCTVWRVKAEWRGPGDRWAITKIGYCLHRDGSWSYEPSPSNRDDEFKANHRFTYTEAIGMLPKALDMLVVNGIRLRDGVLVRSDTGQPIPRESWCGTDPT